MTREVTEIVLKGKVEGLSAYKSVNKAVRSLKDDLASLAIEGKKETALYREKQSRLNVLSTTLQRVKATQSSFNLETKQGINAAKRYVNTLQIGSKEWKQWNASIKTAETRMKQFKGTARLSVFQLAEFGENLTVIGFGIRSLITGFMRLGRFAGRIVGGLVQGLNDVEKSNRKLVASSKLFGVSLQSLQKFAKDAKEEFSLSTVFANDFVTEITKLVSMAGMVDKTGDTLKSALDLGAAQGLDAEQTLVAIRQAILGIDEGTDKLFQKNPSQIYKEYAETLGISAGKMTDLQKKQALVNEFLEKGKLVQGEYNEALKTTAGAIQVAQVAMEDIVQELGTALQPVISTVAGFVKDFATNLKEVPTAGKLAIAAIGGMIIVVGGLTAGFIALGVSVGFATAGISLLVGAGIAVLAGAVAGATALIVTHIEEVMNWWDANTEIQEAIDGLVVAVNDLIFKITGATDKSKGFTKILKDSIRVIARIAEVSIPFMANSLNRLIKVMGVLIDITKRVVGVTKFWINIITDVVTWVKKAVDSVEGFVKKILTLNGLLGLPANLAFFNSIKTAIDVITNSLLGVLGLLFQISNTEVSRDFSSDFIDSDDAVNLIQKRKTNAEVLAREKLKRQKTDLPGDTNKGGKSGTDSTKEEKDALDELIKSIDRKIRKNELEKTITASLVRGELERLNLAENLADTEDKRIKFLEKRKDLEEKIWEVIKMQGDALKIGEVSKLPERTTQLLQDNGANPREGSSAFGVVVLAMKEAFEEVNTMISDSLSNVTDIMTILNIGTESFVGKVIEGFNSVLTIIGSIINIISQVSSGGGIFGGLLKLAGIIAAPFTGGASLGASAAAGGFATGTDSYPGGVGLTGEAGRELVSLPPMSSILNNENTERLFGLMNSINKPVSPQLNQSIQVSYDERGDLAVYVNGKRQYKKMQTHKLG